jgi:hypothetical protein
MCQLLDIEQVEESLSRDAVQARISFGDHARHSAAQGRQITSETADPGSHDLRRLDLVTDVSVAAVSLACSRS